MGSEASIINPSLPQTDHKPIVDNIPLPEPKELVKKGISLDLISSSIGLGGLRFMPIGRESKEIDGNQTHRENSSTGNTDWEDDDEDDKELELEIAVHTYNTMTKEERKEVLDLLEDNMKVMYQNAQGGWSRPRKIQEFSSKTHHMRFLLARPLPPSSSPTSSQPLAGFLAFTAIEEELVYNKPGTPIVPVLYCWEIQITPGYQGMGLGWHLMEQLHTIAERVGIYEVRLTVFRNNAKARRFYDKLGYVLLWDHSGDDFCIMKKIIRA